MTALGKRAGRPRKPAVRRDRKGRIASVAPADRHERAQACVISYRLARGARKEHVMDQRYGYELGRLCIARKITDGQHDAGMAYQRLVGKMRAAIKAPRPTAQAVGYGEGSGGTYRPDPDQDSYAALLRRYNAAYVALIHAGRDAVMAVNDAVIRDTDAAIEPLRLGLTALRRHFRMPDYQRDS